MFREISIAIGLLVLRLSFGFMMLLGHGWAKVEKFSVLAEEFADPLGFGVYPSLILAIAAEVGCSILIILGLGTRLATIPLIITMLVAIFIVHGADPMFGPKSKEPATIYLSAYLTLLLAGPGFLSLDRLVTMFFNDRKVTAGKVK